MVVLACTARGLEMCRELSERAHALRELEQLIEMLKREIEYAATPMWEAFRELAARSGKRFCGFLRDMAQTMEQRESGSMGDVFAKCAKNLYGKSGLSKADVERLTRMGSRLGYLDRTMQVRNLALYQEELARDRARAEEDYRQKAKIYRSLGFLGGLFLALLFL